MTDGRAPSTRLRVAVLGPGGIGGMIGALLARDGHAVTCIARRETAAHLAASGLHLLGDRFGDFTVPVDTATELQAPVDVAFVATKTTSLDAALERVPPAALGGGLLVPFCNGVDHVEHLRERYPPEQVVAATIQVSSTRTAPGEIVVHSGLALVEIATGTADRSRVEALARALRAAGLDVNVRTDERPMLWDKLAILGPPALACTASRATLGDVRAHHGDELRELVGEYVQVAAAEGATLDAGRIMDLYERQLPPDMKPSMLRDAEARRPTEVDAIGGAVVRAGRRDGIPTPVATRLVRTIRDGERHRTARPAAR